MNVLLSLENMAESLSERSPAILAVTLVMALLNCFLGYKLMKFWMAIFGVIAGGALGYFLAAKLTEISWLPYLAMAAGALLFGAAAFWIYQAGVFLLCGTVGTLIFSVLIRPKSSLIFFLCMFLGGCIGVFGVKFIKPMVIFLTALHGGFTLGVLALSFLGLEGKAITVVIGIAFTVMGILFQAATNRKRAALEEEEED